MEFEVKNKRKRPKKTWKTQMEKESKRACWFGKGGCHDRARWRVGVGEIAVRVG